MLGLFQAALGHHGIDDKVLVVGQFAPRGQSGAMFAGGMLGGEAPGGRVAEGLGLGAGVIAGSAANAASSGLPRLMQVGVSGTKVYGMHSRSRSREPDEIVFPVPRAGLTAKVHQRVNVRVLELIDDATGSRIELEGNRLPITHSHDVIEELSR